VLDEMPRAHTAHDACFPVAHRQDVPMVIVSHDREFLDNLCTKIVETERCVATTYKVRAVSWRGGGGCIWGYERQRPPPDACPRHAPLRVHAQAHNRGLT
jgi:hypothetical protein